MKIHGVRIYTNCQMVLATDCPMYIHDSLCRECSDFYFLFHPMAERWRDTVIADIFPVHYDGRGLVGDPIAGLREKFGSSLIDANVKSQFMLLRGGDFARWGPNMHYVEGAFLPVFQESPGYDVLNGIYHKLTSDTWPAKMKGLVHMWDDVYWQYFSRDESDIEFLIQAHAQKHPKLEMYYVDFDREYPDPSNEDLKPVG